MFRLVFCRLGLVCSAVACHLRVLKIQEGFEYQDVLDSDCCQNTSEFQRSIPEKHLDLGCRFTDALLNVLAQDDQNLQKNI